MSETGATIRFLNPEPMPRPYGYSQVAEVTGGRTVYISGQVPLNANNDLVGPGDFTAQARQVFANVRYGLNAVGLDLTHVVKLQIYVTDMANMIPLRSVRDEFVNTALPPASTAVQVAALFRPDVLIELDVVAVG